MNKIKFGLRNVSYAKITETAGEITYGTPVKVPGAVTLTLDPAGENSEFYADDILYFNQATNQGYTGELVIANLPESFLTDILGMKTDKNGALIECADDMPSSFALGYEIQGDKKGTKFWNYNCSCARPGQEANTKESSITPSTDGLSLTVAPRSTDKKVRVKMTESETNKTAYDSFFTEVYEEVITP